MSLEQYKLRKENVHLGPEPDKTSNYVVEIVLTNCSCCGKVVLQGNLLIFTNGIQSGSIELGNICPTDVIAAGKLGEKVLKVRPNLGSCKT